MVAGAGAGGYKNRSSEATARQLLVNFEIPDITITKIYEKTPWLNSSPYEWGRRVVTGNNPMQISSLEDYANGGRELSVNQNLNVTYYFGKGSTSEQINGPVLLWYEYGTIRTPQRSYFLSFNGRKGNSSSGGDIYYAGNPASSPGAAFRPNGSVGVGGSDYMFDGGSGGATIIFYGNTAPKLQSFTITRPNGQTASNGVYLGETLTLTGRITDDDGNLDKTSFWWDGGVGARWRNAGGNGWEKDDRGWSNFPAYVVGATNDRTITATWTPIGVGTYIFHHAGGDSAGAWVDANGVQSEIEVKVKPSPTISMQYLDAAKNVLASNSIMVGSTFYIRVNGDSQNDGTNIATYYSRINRPDKTPAAYEEQSGSSTSGYADFGPYYADVAGVWDGWAHVRNADEGGWVDGQSRGWASTVGPDLTVLSPPPPYNGITYNSFGLPATGYRSETITFNASIRNSGTKNFGANHYIVLRAQGSAVDLAAASLNGVGAGQSANVPFTLTLPASPGTYAYTLNALENGVEWFGGTYSASITVLRRLYTVTVTVVGGGSVTGAGSYYDGDTCTLVPIPNASVYFTGFVGDQFGPGATESNPSPSISFSVNQNMSITATFTGKLTQVVSVSPPGFKLANYPPFDLAWINSTVPTNAPTSGTIDSGPATINVTQVTLNGTPGTVRATLNWPGTTFYLPASASVDFSVGAGGSGTIIDVLQPDTVVATAANVVSSATRARQPTPTASASEAPVSFFAVDSSAQAKARITATRNLIAGIGDGTGITTSPTDNPPATGGSSNPPAGNTNVPGSTPGQQMTYQGYVWTWQYIGQNRLEWVKGAQAK
jgi:hypothetical protein